MSGKIFRSVFGTAMVVLAVSFLMVFNLLLNFCEARVFSELESEAEYISYWIKADEEGFLKSLEGASNRITLIAPDGIAISDNKENTENLSSHIDREEVRQAMENGTGKSERYSETLTEKTLYYAMKLDNGNVLRVSATQSSVFSLLLGFLQPIIWIVAIALVMSLFLAYKLSNAITKPINAIDLEHPEENAAYSELTPLLKKITLQKKTINSQIKDAEKSREEFRLICDNMSEGFLVIDKNAEILSFNHAALNLLGTKSIENKSVFTLTGNDEFNDAARCALSGARVQSSMESGNMICNIIATPVNTADKTIGAVIVILDVTESAKREKLRREFTSNVSHELKTPLTSISGFAEMMKSGLTDADTVADFSNSIYEEAQRLIGLVGDIIKISELDEGAVSFDSELVDLYALSENILERMKPVADKEGVRLSLSGENAQVKGSAKILDEMVYNLLDNAVKYNKRGGMAEIVVSADSGKAKLTVRDNGIGIPKAEQPRVFERFYRVDKSRSKAVGGTGLGLAIVKHGAMFHGISVNLESDEGEGTAVTLTFAE